MDDDEWVYLRGNRRSNDLEDGFFAVYTSKLPQNIEDWDKKAWEYLWRVDILNITWYGGDE